MRERSGDGPVDSDRRGAAAECAECATSQRGELVKTAADEVYSQCYCGEAEAEVGTASVMSTSRACGCD